jgi:hypothetical protein
MRLADLLLISGKRGSETATRAYHQWLREQVARNTPFDQLTQTLLTSTGQLTQVAPANFFTLANLQKLPPGPRAEITKEYGDTLLKLQSDTAALNAYLKKNGERGELARAIGYELKPGVAASVYLTWSSIEFVRESQSLTGPFQAKVHFHELRQVRR